MWVYQKRGQKRRLVERKETFQYIPLIANLQALLQNKEVFSEVYMYMFTGLNSN